MPFVRPYVRSDGTPVRGHSRWAPGARREMTIFAVVGLAVLGIGNASTTTEADSTSPEPPVTYPILFEHSTNSAPKTAVPRPTASYPVKFDMPALQQAAPTPSVSYPIDLSALAGER
ncbi:hypothetical protein [Streptomyces europaeiscabiei]|uniref:hypothetical protein n=1 Tax=Streptomyces europaeiscabiei TaxID=146819 RepID=UPI000E67EC0B|nr:hypothetical protein [Streptomyces europaeiscabiei]